MPNASSRAFSSARAGRVTPVQRQTAAQAQRHHFGPAAAAIAAVAVLTAAPAGAELNKFEANAGGEFGMGSAQQFGEADVKDRDFSNQVWLRPAYLPTRYLNHTNWSYMRVQGACGRSGLADCASRRIGNHTACFGCGHTCSATIRRNRARQASRLRSPCAMCCHRHKPARSWHMAPLQDLRRSNFTSADARCSPALRFDAQEIQTLIPGECAVARVASW